MNRIIWIDALRAMAIIFVVFGHQTSWCDVFFVISTPIKMPLFFMISGFLFKIDNITLTKKFKHLSFRLGIPWLILGLGPVFLASLWRGEIFRIGTYFLDMISGKVLWFMPCFFISEVLFFINAKATNNSLWYTAIICITQCFLGYFLGIFHLADYAMINRAFISQLFMFSGFFVKKHKRYFETISPSYIFLLFFIGVFLSFIEYYYTGLLIDIHTNHYPCFVLDMLIILIECISIFSIFMHFKYGNKISSLIGRNTLLIFILAPYFSAAFQKLFSAASIIINSKYVSSIIMSSLVIMIGAFLSDILAKIAPWVIGQRNKK